MLPHQQRVLDEQHELGERLAKLALFINSPLFTKVPEDEQARLLKQARHMDDYHNVLVDRIEHFDE